MVMSHYAQSGRPRSANLIIIDRWQRTSYRVDLQQTENIDPTARFH